jgi:hypothetical protein
MEGCATRRRRPGAHIALPAATPASRHGTTEDPGPRPRRRTDTKKSLAEDGFHSFHKLRAIVQLKSSASPCITHQATHQPKGRGGSPSLARESKSRGRKLERSDFRRARGFDDNRDAHGSRCSALNARIVPIAAAVH